LTFGPEFKPKMVVVSGFRFDDISSHLSG
jgi:hypothetical protein